MPITQTEREDLLTPRTKNKKKLAAATIQKALIDYDNISPDTVWGRTTLTSVLIERLEAAGLLDT